MKTFVVWLISFALLFSISIPAYAEETEPPGEIAPLADVTSRVTLTVAHDPAAGGTFVNALAAQDPGWPGVNPGTADPVELLYDWDTGAFYYFEANTALEDLKPYAGHELSFKGTPAPSTPTNYYIRSIELQAFAGASQAGAAVAKTDWKSAGGTQAISEADLAAMMTDAGVTEISLLCTFSKRYYAIRSYFQKPDGSWPTDAEMPTDYIFNLVNEMSTSMTQVYEDDDEFFGFTPIYRLGYHYDRKNKDKVIEFLPYLYPDETGFPTTFKYFYALNDYTVKYDLDGGTLAGAAAVPDKTGVHWTTDGLLPQGTPEKTNYAFAGWELRQIDYPSATADTDVAAGAQTVAAATTFEDLMKAWAVKDPAHTSNPTNEDGVTLKLVAVWTPVRYYVMRSYFQKPDGSWPTDAEMPTDYIFNLVNKMTAMQNVVWEDDDPQFFTPIYRPGYHYDGNNKGKVLGMQPYLYPGETGFPTTFKYFYALNDYTVKYDLDGGTLAGAAAVPDKTGVYWTTAGLLPQGTPEKSGYTFSGWELRRIDYPQTSPDTDVAAGKQKVAAATTFETLMKAWAAKDPYHPANPVDEAGTALTLVALWTPVPAPPVPQVPKYSVTYDANIPDGADGSGVSMPQNVTGVPQGQTVQLISPTGVPVKKGGTYAFSYWLERAQTEVAYAGDGMIANIQADHALVAVWTFTPNPVPYDPGPQAPTPKVVGAFLPAVVMVEPAAEPEPSVPLDGPEPAAEPEPAVEPEPAETAGIAAGTLPVGTTDRGGGWSLVSLILSAAAVIVALLTLITGIRERKRRKMNLATAFTLVFGVVTPVFWLMVDSLKDPMVWVNEWTFAVCYLFLMEIALLVVHVLTRKAQDKDKEEDAEEKGMTERRQYDILFT